MSCELLEAYFDDELDAVQQAAMERHIGECANCTASYARLREQRAAIRGAAPYYAAPSELRQSVRAALRPARAVPWRGFAIAASLLLVASVSWNVVQSRHPAEADADAVLTSHIRSLLGSHLLDVPSSDQHTVKPWFAGQLDFAPVVKDLGPEGFPLVGGRLDYLEGRRVAVLVYRRRQHVINLFTWPGSGAESRITRNGYNIIHWSAGPMTYWAVSDVSMPELEHFRQRYDQ